MSTIKKAAVIGAGVMGSGIAAHLANAGLDVVLLDMEKKFADGGVARDPPRHLRSAISSKAKHWLDAPPPMTRSWDERSPTF